MIKICPYDFAQIKNDKNIAYELFFSTDMQVEDLKNDEDFTELTKKIVVHNDQRRKTRFPNTFTNETTDPSILLENGKTEGKSGLSLLLKRIEKKRSGEGNNALAVRPADDSYYETDDEEEDSDYLTDPDEDDFETPESDKTYHLASAIPDKGMYTFYNPYQQIVMSALPCCPYCHMRLPIGWEKAEDFCAVSLMGPTGSGKTTMLLSLMTNDWEKLNGFTINGKPLHITSAQRSGYGGNYDELLEASEELYKHKKCPPETDTAKWILPVFLQVDYDGHKLIMGIYDNAGENLSRFNPLQKTFLRPLIDKTFADIYLFDPKDMAGVEFRPKSLSKSQETDVFDQSEIISIDNQGEFQKKNYGKRVRGSELLDEAVHNDTADNIDVIRDRSTLDVYNSMMRVRQGAGCLPSMRNMYFIGVIIKCDLLEGMGGSKYDVLFDRTNVGMTDINQMTGRSGMVVDMIKELKLFGNRDVDEIGSYYGKGTTWQCISALGCDAELHGELLGEYAPIRVAEPLITCIIRRLADNGWIK